MVYDSNDQSLIDEAYATIVKDLDSKLSTQGYQVVHEQHNDEVFGSRYIIWSDNYGALGFTWDGKESVFILEVVDSLPLSSANIWTDIAMIAYQPKKHDNASLSIIITTLLDSLKG